MHEVYKRSRADCVHGPRPLIRTWMQKPPKGLKKRGAFLFIQQRGINSNDASQMHVPDTEFGEADMLSTAKVVKAHLQCQRDLKG